MRLFIAITPPAEVKSAVGAAASGLAKKGGGSWVKSESYHLTVAFLGEQTETGRDAAVAALASVDVSPLTHQYALGSAGFFPNERRPRVGWLSVVEPEPLMELASWLRAALSACGVNFDPKPFKPHLTLVRIKEPWSVEKKETFVTELAALNGLPLKFDRLTLYASQLSSKGAIHTVVSEKVV